MTTTDDAPVTPLGDTPATPAKPPRKPRTAGERRKAAGATKPASREREYLIRRRIDTVPFGFSWLDVGTVSAKSREAALDRYALEQGAAMDPSPHEAITARHRLERTPNVEVQTIISWS